MQIEVYADLSPPLLCIVDRFCVVSSLVRVEYIGGGQLGARESRAGMAMAWLRRGLRARHCTQSCKSPGPGGGLKDCPEPRLGFGPPASPESRVAEHRFRSFVVMVCLLDIRQA